MAESSLDENFNRCCNTEESMIHLPLQGIHKGVQTTNSGAVQNIQQANQSIDNALASATHAT
eukprot:1622349-Ditylum_brightwellii.AAC.1